MTSFSNWEFVPGVSIGPIAFGDNAGPHVKELGLEEQERDFDGQDEWIHYESHSGDFSILAVNGRITAATCERTCLYRGNNLIGLTEPELRSALADATCKLSDDLFGYSLEFERIGLDVQIRGGCVARVTVSVDPDSVL